MGQKLLPLESLRGLAALSVAVYHIEVTSLITDSSFVRHSYWLVDFFFILSGFVIAYTYLDRMKSWSDISQFQMRRFWRLYPLHLATLLLFLGIEFARFGATFFLGVKSNIEAFSQNDWTAFLSNLFLLQSFYPDHPSFNYPSWSISTEFYTYFVFACVIFAGRRHYILASVLIVITAYLSQTIMAAYIADSGYETTQLRFLRCLLGFFLGVILFSIYKANKGQRACPEFVWLAFLVATIILIANSDHVPRPLIYAAFAGLILSVLTVRPTAFTVRIISAPFLVYLGTISYSLYMLHAGLWWVNNQIFRFVLKIPTIDVLGRGEIYQLPTGWGEISVIVSLVVLLGISHFTYHMIESRFRNGIRPFSAGSAQSKRPRSGSRSIS